MGLAHTGHNQLADSHSGEATKDEPNEGISRLGQDVIAEMNRVGMMVDLSHLSRAAALQAIALSKAPVIASHSAVRALVDHNRNLDDEQLLAVKKNGGVV
jgi:membrane dipeptidase